MKIHYLLFITFLFIQFTSTAQEGWFEQASGVTIDLRSVCFVDENVGLAVGDSGTILKTTDGGKNWNSNMIGTTGGLIKVQFSDDSTAWAINGTYNPGDVLYKSTNQGEDWSLVYSKPGYSFRGLFFLNSDTGWVGGNQGLLLRTTSGGDNWEEIDIDSSEYFFFSDIFFVDKNNGWLVVSELGGGYEDLLLKTTDGGHNWIELFGFGNQTVFFIDENTGWHAQSWIFGGILWETTNGGFNWVKTLESSCGFHDVYFTNYVDGWVISGCFDSTISSEIYMSTNGGTDWELQLSNDEFRLYSLYFLSNQIGWVVGSSGAIFKTTTGGISFVEEKITDLPTKYSVTQNFPNPFNPTTKIKYQIPKSSNVVVKVFDILGNEIETLVNKEKQVGTYELTWYAEGLPSGVYFYRLQAGDFVETKKMVLMK